MYVNDSPIHLRKYSFFEARDHSEDSVTVPVWLTQGSLDALNAIIRFSEGMGQGKVPGSFELVMFYRTIRHCLEEAEKQHRESLSTMDKRPDAPDGAKGWFLTETLCELCAKRATGCAFQFDSEQCRSSRNHYLGDSNA